MAGAAALKAPATSLPATRPFTRPSPARPAATQVYAVKLLTKKWAATDATTAVDYGSIDLDEDLVGGRASLDAPATMF